MRKKLTYLVSGWLPAIFVKYAFYKLTRPKKHTLRPHEKEVLDQATQSTYSFRDFSIQLYEWKAGPQKVFLIHGWEGNAGNFAELIEKCLEKNITVFAFDGPGHGQSSCSNKGTSLFEFADLVEDLIRKFEINKLVSHSFGGVATTYALSKNPDFQIEKYVLFTTPNRFLDRIDEAMHEAGVHPKVKRKLCEMLEKKFNLDLIVLNVDQFVQTANVAEALIFHDTNDRVLSVKESRAVAEKWATASLIEVTKTGHYRLMRTDEVLEKGMEFLDFNAPLLDKLQ